MFNPFHYTSSIAERARAVLGSLVVNATILTAFAYSLSDHQEIQSPKKSIEQIIAETPCTPNLHHNTITLQEQEFLWQLTEDLKDKKLDSMSFGKWMTTAEVYVQNSEQYCQEQKWDLKEELDFYNEFKDFGISNEKAKEEMSRILYILQSSILKTPENYQARPVLTSKTNIYDCKSGTQWHIALAEENPITKGKVFAQVYDDHVNTVLIDEEKIFYYESIDSAKAFIPKRKGVIRPKEMFIVEYLLARGIPITELPQEFQDWYKKKAATQGILKTSTNTFGQEAKVGIRRFSLDQELEFAPTKYEMQRCEGQICAVYFDSNAFNWKNIMDKAYSKIFEIDAHNFEDYKEQVNLTNKCIFAAQQVFFENEEERLNLGKDRLSDSRLTQTSCRDLRSLGLLIIWGKFIINQNIDDNDRAQNIAWYITFGESRLPKEKLDELIHLKGEVYTQYPFAWDLIIDNILDHYEELDKSPEGRKIIQTAKKRTKSFLEYCKEQEPSQFSCTEEMYNNLIGLAYGNYTQTKAIIEQMQQEGRGQYLGKSIVDLIDTYDVEDLKKEQLWPLWKQILIEELEKERQFSQATPIKNELCLSFASQDPVKLKAFKTIFEYCN